MENDKRVSDNQPFRATNDDLSTVRIQVEVDAFLDRFHNDPHYAIVRRLYPETLEQMTPEMLRYYLIGMRHREELYGPVLNPSGLDIATAITVGGLRERVRDGAMEVREEAGRA